MEQPQPFAWYPVFLNIRGKRCVVVGGGRVALQKVRVLLECGANVTVVSPQIHSEELARLAETGTITLKQRRFAPGDLEAALIAVAATDVHQANHNVALEARKRGLLVNVVDNPQESDFIVPSSIRRGDLTIAISTAGSSPALARKLRTRLEERIGKEFTGLLPLIKEVRSELKQKGVEVSADTWQDALDLDVLLEFGRAGQWEEAHAFLLNRLTRDMTKA